MSWRSILSSVSNMIPLKMGLFFVEIYYNRKIFKMSYLKVYVDHPFDGLSRVTSFRNFSLFCRISYNRLKILVHWCVECQTAFCLKKFTNSLHFFIFTWNFEKYFDNKNKRNSTDFYFYFLDTMLSFLLCSISIYVIKSCLNIPALAKSLGLRLKIGFGVWHCTVKIKACL